jgi:hypothetical protein
MAEERPPPKSGKGNRSTPETSEGGPQNDLADCLRTHDDGVPPHNKGGRSLHRDGGKWNHRSVKLHDPAPETSQILFSPPAAFLASSFAVHDVAVFVLLLVQLDLRKARLRI